MRKPKMGGGKRLHVFIKGNDDVRDSLLSSREGGKMVRRGLRELIRDKYLGDFNIETDHEPCGRFDLLLQQLGGSTFAEDLSKAGLDIDGNFLAAQFQSRLFEEAPDLIVFSIQSEVDHDMWRHRQKGYFFCPPPRWEQVWSPYQKEWFLEQFSTMGLIEVHQFKENFIRLIKAVKERLDAHIIVYNRSSMDPDDHTHNYHGLEETLALRIHKFNLALMEISVLEGISIIDVDRLTAEFDGRGGRHALKALHFTICQEFLRVLEDIGFFENRPLVMQMGRRGNQDALEARNAVH